MAVARISAARANAARPIACRSLIVSGSSDPVELDSTGGGSSASGAESASEELSTSGGGPSESDAEPGSSGGSAVEWPYGARALARLMGR